MTLQPLSSVTEEDTSPLQHCNVNVEYVQSDEDADSTTDSPECRRLQSLYMDLRREMFANRILSNEASWRIAITSI